MSLDSDINLLSKVRLFEGFSHEHLRLLAFGAEARRVPVETVLYKKGAYSDGGYVIASGSVSLLSGPKDEIVSSYGPAALIGELALISAVDHATTAVVTENAQILKIPRSLFRRMLEEYPDLANTLHQRISQSVEGFLNQLETVAGKLDRANDQLSEKAEKSKKAKKTKA